MTTSISGGGGGGGGGLQEALAGNTKNDGMFVRCWFCYIFIAKFWVLEYCPVVKNKVLMLIKV